MIFDIQGAWIDCARNKVLGIYSYIVIISYWYCISIDIYTDDWVLYSINTGLPVGSCCAAAWMSLVHACITLSCVN